MSNAEEYVGCLDISSARHYSRREYSHSEIGKGGREIKYYHCYRIVKSPSGPFSENEIPNKAKIKKFERFWRWYGR